MLDKTVDIARNLDRVIARMKRLENRLRDRRANGEEVEPWDDIIRGWYKLIARWEMTLEEEIAKNAEKEIAKCLNKKA
jgi:hypothetical protein